jgi:hypothetical protein
VSAGYALGTEVTMAEKLKRIFEYRVLLSKTQKRQPDLDPDERLRLDRLGQQLPLTAPALDDRDPYTMLGEPLPVEFALEGRFATGSLRNASGGGLAIATAQPPALGQPLVIHVQDRKRAVVYSFPGRVVSRVLSGTPGMSVAFDGVPNQTKIAASMSSGVWSAQNAQHAQVGDDARSDRPNKQRDSA